MAKKQISNTSTAKKKATPKAKVTQDPHEVEKIAHEKATRVFFTKLGFAHIDSDGLEINFMGRAGELDGIFIYENVLLILEYTVGKSGSTHLLKKKVLYDYILQNPADFVDFAKSTYPDFTKALNPVYGSSVYKICIIYASKNEPSDQLIGACPDVNFFYGPRAKYFHALVSTIEKSARMEFFKYLGLRYDEVGELVMHNGKSSITYEGFLVPDGACNFPSKYQVVSFYADPEHLIASSYVLRRDSWRDDDYLYQRILLPKKIRQMREYLTKQERAFVNNIIVTLPESTEFIGKNNKPIKGPVAKVTGVSVRLPDEFDTLGLIDGQHRVFCYHEGTDKAEDSIKTLRKKQNLLVTGIMYPEGTTDLERRKFEAKLFLEINNNQASATAALKHEIEVIITPNSQTAIAKRVLQELGRRGPYKGMLQTSYFDRPAKIKTSSIVNYGLAPLVKTSGTDSLFSVWTHPEREKIKNPNDSMQETLISDYVKFCTDKLNEFFVEVKIALPKSGAWDIDANPRSPLLTPTAINGQISFLRKIIEDGHPLEASEYKKRLVALEKFDFSSYTSSRWQLMGAALYSTHYQK